VSCICGHEEEEHRDGSECQVEGCLCACYEPDDYEAEPKEET
jgi:hypothetical protein